VGPEERLPPGSTAAEVHPVSPADGEADEHAVPKKIGIGERECRLGGSARVWVVQDEDLPSLRFSMPNRFTASRA